MFQIEQGVPIPEIRRSGRPLKYPLLNMEVGESFVCEGPGSRIMSSIKYARRHNATLKYVTRKVDQKNIRVWRIA